MLEISDLTVAYGKHVALDGVSLQVGQGEMVAILGANGAGKSSILGAVGGRVTPAAGQIVYRGDSLPGLPQHRLVEMGIALVPEGRGIFPGLSVAENLALGAHPARARAGMAARRAEIFDLFPRLAERQGQIAGTMSGGEQQMVAIGRALMSAPDLLLLDEPSLGLAPIVVQEVFAALARIRATGLTVVIVEQNARATLALAESTAPLRRGLAELGRMADAARRVNRLLPGEAPTPATMPAPAPVADAPALAFRSVTFRHPGAARAVLSGFDLTGETVALTGPSGGGKSTILSLAAGLIAPEAGEIALFGQPLTGLSEHALRARLTYLPQRSALLGGSLFETLALADPDLTEAQAQSALVAMQLDDMARRRGGLHAPLKDNGAGLSGGEQRRLALARALLRRPALLLLDEPTEGLDRDTASVILSQIRQALPHAAIVVAAHRAVEQSWADRTIDVGQS